MPQLTFEETQRGHEIIMRMIQASTFHVEIDLLQHEVPIRRGPLRALSAFIDPDDGLIRVGGRLQRGDIPDQTFIVVLQHWQSHYDNVTGRFKRREQHRRPGVVTSFASLLHRVSTSDSTSDHGTAADRINHRSMPIFRSRCH